MKHLNSEANQARPNTNNVTPAWPINFQSSHQSWQEQPIHTENSNDRQTPHSTRTHIIFGRPEHFEQTPTHSKWSSSCFCAYTCPKTAHTFRQHALLRFSSNYAQNHNAKRFAPIHHRDEPHSARKALGLLDMWFFAALMRTFAGFWRLLLSAAAGTVLYVYCFLYQETIFTTAHAWSRELVNWLKVQPYIIDYAKWNEILKIDDKLAFAAFILFARLVWTFIENALSFLWNRAKWNLPT